MTSDPIPSPAKTAIFNVVDTGDHFNRRNQSQQRVSTAHRSPKFLVCRTRIIPTLLALLPSASSLFQPILCAAQVDRKLHGLNEFANFALFFATFTVLYAACNVNSMRSEQAHRFSNVFRGQPARQHNRFIQGYLIYYPPVEPLPGSTKKPVPITIEQKCKNRITPSIL